MLQCNIIIDSLNHFAHHLRCEPVHNVTDIAEFRNFGFNFFPNPANKSITINTYPLNFPATIEIFNNIGQLCMSETIFGYQNTQINISKLKPGSYFIRFNSKNYTGFKMIVIETDG